jgi:hypothetical protein
VRNVEGTWAIIDQVKATWGLQPIGYGTYSVVLATACRKALKIGFCPEDGGLAFAAWCRQSVYAATPEVYGIASTEYCYAVVTERLEKWDGDSLMGQWEQHRRGMTGHTENASAMGRQLHRFFDGVGTLDSNPDNFMVRPGKTPELVLVDGLGQIGCSRLTGDEV